MIFEKKLPDVADLIAEYKLSDDLVEKRKFRIQEDGFTI